jgi:hypothetical protein
LPVPGFAVTDKNMQLSHILVAMAALSVSAAPMMERMLSPTSTIFVISLIWKAEGKTDAIDNVKSELFFIAYEGPFFFNPKAK